MIRIIIGLSSKMSTHYELSADELNVACRAMSGQERRPYRLVVRLKAD